MLDRALRGRKAWRRDGLRREDWLAPISKACLEEIDEFVRTLRDNPMTTVALEAAAGARLLLRTRSMMVTRP